MQLLEKSSYLWKTIRLVSVFSSSVCLSAKEQSQTYCVSICCRQLQIILSMFYIINIDQSKIDSMMSQFFIIESFI